MKLTDKQVAFLIEEFGIDADTCLEFGYDDINDLRKKCFDIETEEATAADNENRDISDRGETAADLVDFMRDHIRSRKLTAASA